MLQCIKNTKLAQFVPECFCWCRVFCMCSTYLLHEYRRKKSKHPSNYAETSETFVLAILCFPFRLTLYYMGNNFVDWKIHVQLLRTFCCRSLLFFFCSSTVHLRSSIYVSTVVSCCSYKAAGVLHVSWFNFGKQNENTHTRNINRWTCTSYWFKIFRLMLIANG